MISSLPRGWRLAHKQLGMQEELPEAEAKKQLGRLPGVQPVEASRSALSLKIIGKLLLFPTRTELPKPLSQFRKMRRGGNNRAAEPLHVRTEHEIEKTESVRLKHPVDLFSWNEYAGKLLEKDLRLVGDNRLKQLFFRRKARVERLFACTCEPGNRAHARSIKTFLQKRLRSDSENVFQTAGSLVCGRTAGSFLNCGLLGCGDLVALICQVFYPGTIVVVVR